MLRSVLRFCPICDAFEAIDQRIAVIGDGALGEREASFLEHYSARYLLHIEPASVAATAGTMSPSGIEHISIQLSDLRILPDRVTLAGDGERSFDVVYLALGCSARNGLRVP